MPDRGMGIAMKILDHEGDKDGGASKHSPYTNACARVLLAMRKDDAEEFGAALRDAIALADAGEPGDAYDEGDET